MSEKFELSALSDRVRFILINPSHPGNIGATARAMKNMGWHRLVLVCETPPDLEAAAPMATSAVDIVQNAVVVKTLDEALKGVSFAVGTTGRPRQWDYLHCTARGLPQLAIPRLAEGDLAILFGTERFGLSNEALYRCQAVCEIDTAGMKSLNLAQAVLIISYELMMGAREFSPAGLGQREVIGLEELEPLVQRWVKVWQAVGYMKDRNPDHFLMTLRQILGRAAMEPREMHVLMGFFNKVRHYIHRTGGDISLD